jgi:hypothetical protein
MENGIYAKFNIAKGAILETYIPFDTWNGWEFCRISRREFRGSKAEAAQ